MPAPKGEGGYWNVEHHLRLFGPEPRNILFVVPGSGRIETLRRALAHEQEEERERTRRDRWHIPFQAAWPMLAATASELRRQGPLPAVWHSITDRNEPPRALTELPVRRGLGSANPEHALGRRWRHDQPDFWKRLSPLHRHAHAPAPTASADENACSTEATAPDLPAEPLDPGALGLATGPEAEAFHEQLQRLRRAEFDEIERGLPGARSSRGAGSS